MNQVKIDPYDEKTLKLGKHTIFGRERGQPNPRKKKK